VSSGSAAIGFYQAAFGAEVHDRIPGDAVARLTIGDAQFWITEDADSKPARLVLTFADPDAAFARAVDAGATAVAEVHEEHGWRVGRVADPYGHHWELARRS
jgi:PhnB protein